MVLTRDTVIEIDEVEYLIDEFAAKMIEKDEEEIVLVRLFDHTPLILSSKQIKEIIDKDGIIDHVS